MGRLHQQHPNDHEIATFYALSLLGTLRPGDKGFRRQALAASIALKVFQENPNHPGAAHFVIHSFDDPDHAPLGLPMARAYSKIAPAAAHAQHISAEQGAVQEHPSQGNKEHHGQHRHRDLANSPPAQPDKGAIGGDGDRHAASLEQRQAAHNAHTGQRHNKRWDAGVGAE